MALNNYIIFTIMPSTILKITSDPIEIRRWVSRRWPANVLSCAMASYSMLGGRSLKPVRMRVDEGKSKRFAFQTDGPELVCDISRLKVPRSGGSRCH